MGPLAMILVFWMLSFRPVFSLSSFKLIKRLFSFSLLSDISVLSFAYLRLLVFLPTILIIVYNSSRPAFFMMYSTYKLNKQDDNIQPWWAPFFQFWTSPLFHVRFQPLLLDLHTGFSGDRWVGWYSHLFKNFQQFVVMHTVKGFSVVSESEVAVFLLLSLCSSVHWQFNLYFLCLF